jgi:hypothetical protein
MKPLQSVGKMAILCIPTLNKIHLIMYLKSPEQVEFDPANREHRAAARAFMKRKAWVDSPIRFAHDPNYGSIAEQVQAKLLDWYIKQEDARDAKRRPDLKKVA